ncbi:MAG: hypothetical protein GXO36_07155, partial [Chloroflexi bacterium]|nr:hypothetical protein [Chloroflexota bacterium]
MVGRRAALFVLGLLLVSLGLGACGSHGLTPQPPTPSLTQAPTETPSPTATPTITPTPTNTATPTITPTPTPRYPVHSGTPLPSLLPLSQDWEAVRLVAEYIAPSPGLLVRASLRDVLAIYGDRVEVYRDAKPEPHRKFAVHVDPFLDHFSVSDT